MVIVVRGQNFQELLERISSLNEESLDDLSEIVGPELANLVNGGGAAATTAGNALTTLQPPAKVTAGSTGQQQQGSGDGGDLSDLKSSDLIQTLSAVIDIDKMFADFQSDNRDHQQVSTRQRISKRTINGSKCCRASAC